MSDSSAAQIPVQNQNTTKWAWTIATFFGAGFGKPGPGTWGSAATVLLWAAVAYGLHPAPQTLLLIVLAAIALSLILGIPAATVVARESGRKDPQFVVIDEVAGQAITLLFSPIGWQYALTAFILFRLFDITKPFPVRQLERLPAGWGIVLDDVGAGLYALGIATLLRIYLHL
ncbi:MAG: phosphatidylglycerophosphatase A [Terracidiphilus sp.]|nr:phosphatidylglycerophosphatase A [Terracidiphilus sp.]